MAISNGLIKLIMNCVSTTSFFVLVEGEALEKFVARLGPRQGDPLSPTLFIMVMENLHCGFEYSHLLKKSVLVLVDYLLRGHQLSIERSPTFKILSDSFWNVLLKTCTHGW